MFGVNRNPSPKDLRGFGNAMLIGFGALSVIIGILVPWFYAENATENGLLTWHGSKQQLTATIMIVLGVGLFVLSRVSSSGTRVAYIFWMSVATPIGQVMSTLLLTLMFFVVLAPFALFVGVSDPMGKKRRLSSYWTKIRPYEATLYRMRRPF